MAATLKDLARETGLGLATLSEKPVATIEFE